MYGGSRRWNSTFICVLASNTVIGVEFYDIVKQKTQSVSKITLNG